MFPCISPIFILEMRYNIYDEKYSYSKMLERLQKFIDNQGYLKPLISNVELSRQGAGYYS